MTTTESLEALASEPEAEGWVRTDGQSVVGPLETFEMPMSKEWFGRGVGFRFWGSEGRYYYFEQWITLTARWPTGQSVYGPAPDRGKGASATGSAAFDHQLANASAGSAVMHDGAGVGTISDDPGTSQEAHIQHFNADPWSLGIPSGVSTFSVEYRFDVFVIDAATNRVVAEAHWGFTLAFSAATEPHVSVVPGSSHGP